MRYCFGKFKGDLFSNYWCKVCDDFYKDGKDFEDGVAFAEFKGEEVYKQFRQSYLKNEITTLF